LKDGRALKGTLERIDGKGYKAYKDIAGSYDFGDYTLHVDYVQGDPFAAPSRVRVVVPQAKAQFPGDTYSSRSREVGLRDFITREFSLACKKFVRGRRGSGKSGTISIDQPGQEILERTSAFVGQEQVEARFTMGLPAFGRKVAGKHARAMFFEELPRIVRSSLYFSSLDSQALYRHVESNEDADHLREKLPSLGLIAFVGEGAILPRASGIDPRPLPGEKAVTFESPPSLRVEVELPNRGKVRGMGMEEGVNLVVGGGYHGKSTLLNALELGVYNHVPRDGRELVVTNPKAMKIRAEDGRRVEKVDISPFISNLPFGRDTTEFSSQDASGSTSQATNIMESLEAGAEVLLIDEDTSATNFMIRDHRMQELVSKDREPITPFIDKVRQLYSGLGVSTVLVLGGSGDYFDVADRIICMVEYRPYDYTSEAKAIAEKYRAERKMEGGEGFEGVSERIPLQKSLDPSKGKKKVKISPKGLKTIAFGRNSVNLASVEQLVDVSQTRSIGEAMNYAKRYMDGERTLKEVLEMVEKDMAEKGLDVLTPRPTGDLAFIRPLELACAMNRLRTFKAGQRG